MPRTVTDRGGRRLALAFLAATAVHAILFALLAILVLAASDGGPDGGRLYPVFTPRDEAGNADGTGLPGTAPHDRLYGTEKNTLKADRPEHPKIIETVENATTGDTATTGETATGMGSNNETAVSEGKGVGVGEGVGSGKGFSGSPGERAFVSWLDGAIRSRLSYPRRARERNAEGTVLLALSVPADGSACDARVAQSSGNEILDRAALDLVTSLFPAPVAPETPFVTTVRILFTLTQTR